MISALVFPAMEIWRSGFSSSSGSSAASGISAGPAPEREPGNPLLIGGKKYDHSVLCHANGVMVYNINKEYVRFEAEVGLADQSTVGSVFFRIMNVFPKDKKTADGEFF